MQTLVEAPLIVSSSLLTSALFFALPVGVHHRTCETGEESGGHHQGTDAGYIIGFVTNIYSM